MMCFSLIRLHQNLGAYQRVSSQSPTAHGGKCSRASMHHHFFFKEQTGYYHWSITGFSHSDFNVCDSLKCHYGMDDGGESYQKSFDRAWEIRDELKLNHDQKAGKSNVQIKMHRSKTKTSVTKNNESVALASVVVKWTDNIQKSTNVEGTVISFGRLDSISPIQKALGPIETWAF